MKCKYCCSSHKLIKKGKRGIKQRYKCKKCNKYQLDFYTYKLYRCEDDRKIKTLNAEGVGIRSMSRILGYSQGTIIRRILYMASKITKPIHYERNQVYEVDEMWSFVKKNIPSNYCWITYAINRRTGSVMDVTFGSRSKKNMKQVTNYIKSLKPKKIVTDKLQVYINLIKPIKHDTTSYSNNHIERGNLTLRTHIKRLSRKTICFSKSQKMLEACVLLYFDFHYWKLKKN